MNVIERMQAPTPKFFRKLRNISLVATAIAATLLKAPVDLPAIILNIAQYATVAGTVGALISQTAIPAEAEPQDEPKDEPLNGNKSGSAKQ